MGRYAQLVTAHPAKFKVPWFMLVLVAAIVIGSAAMATATIGPVSARLEVPAVLTYAIPVTTNIAIVVGTWARARSTNTGLRRATRQGNLTVALLLAVAAAVCTQLRLGHFDLVGMAIVGLVSGAGPLTLALVFFRDDKPATDQQNRS